jgi:hypothetical protein
MITIKQPTEKIFEKGDYEIVVTTFIGSCTMKTNTAEIKCITSDNSFSIKDIEKMMGTSRSYGKRICITRITKI